MQPKGLTLKHSNALTTKGALRCVADRCPDRAIARCLQDAARACARDPAVRPCVADRYPGRVRFRRARSIRLRLWMFPRVASLGVLFEFQKGPGLVVRVVKRGLSEEEAERRERPQPSHAQRLMITAESMNLPA
jgi:hypothetical protein